MSQWLVEKSAGFLEAQTSRRGLLVRAAIAGSALAVSPMRYILRPGTAYAAICACAGQDCDCGSACCDGYTEFCCVINNGVNSCPPGTFEAGWWRADGSIYCTGPRYYVDCNVVCGCQGCYPCSCGSNRCDNRRVGCNDFRYGNCHREVECAGPIACRVVTCTPPYQLYPSCDTTVIFDNSTANHTANCNEENELTDAERRQLEQAFANSKSNNETLTRLEIAIRDPRTGLQVEVAKLKDVVTELTKLIQAQGPR